MVNKVIDLLQLARKSGIQVGLYEGELQLKIAKGKTVDPSLIQQIKEHKPAIIDFLNDDTLQAVKVSKKDIEIVPFDRKTITEIPLSFSQERLWFIDQMEGSLQYHLPLILRLKGKLDIAALQKAFKTVIAKHEVLRTVYRQNENGEVFQYLQDEDEWKLHHSVIQNFDQSIINELIGRPFNLSKDYMLHADILQVNDDEYVLVVVLHHIASDGQSLGIFINEVVQLYAGYSLDPNTSFLPLAIQYADYAYWQRTHLTGEALQKKIDYWKNKLAGVEPLELPLDFSRPALQTKEGTSLQFQFDKDVLTKLQSLSQQQGTTLFMTLLAAFKVLLYRYSGQADICIGTPVAGRQQQEVEALIGFFINTLAIRNNINGTDSFTSLLQQVKQTTTEAYENQEVPFEKVVDVVVKKRDLSRSPLFQVLFALQSFERAKDIRLNDLVLSKETNDHATSVFDLSFYVNTNEEGLAGMVEYNTSLYKEATVQRMIGHYKNLLESIVADPAMQVGILPLLDKAEQNQLLYDFNNTKRTFALDDSVVTLIERMAAEAPGGTAVVAAGATLTYKQLNEQANQLAHFLIAKGITKEAIVPLCVERSHAMIVSLIAILKTGACFVPVDPAYPAERIKYMIENAAAGFVVSNTNSKQNIEALQGFEIIDITAAQKEIEAQPVTNTGIGIDKESLAYVIYTSGSTGLPKGVMVTHSGLTNLLLSMQQDIGFTNASSFVSVTTYSFDIAYLELFLPLINGGKLFIADRETAMDGYKLAAMLAAYNPTHLQATPATWILLLESNWQNKEQLCMLVGGEAVSENLKNRLTAIGTVYNVYGPTETTIWSVMKKLSLNEKVIIGKPIANTQVYFLSKEGQLAPLGVSGELCIAGDGLSRGYLHRDDLTAERFITNPFIVNEQQPTSKDQRTLMYRTGDAGRWLPDGTIEYQGRIDEQVKIRGYRIEPGEIEAQVQQSGMTDQAVVVARPDGSGSLRLIGYVTGKDGFDKEALQQYLHSRLPAYMIPAVWIELDAMPLTNNGKINRKALPEPGIEQSSAKEYEAPITSTEAALSDAWKDLLNIQRAGRNDNFFELGGHSLLVMRLVSQVRNKLGKELAVKEVFTHPTLQSLAALIDKSNNKLLLPKIEAITPRPDHVPLSYSQQRLWFIDKLGGSVQYHIPAVLKLEGTIAINALTAALTAVVDRHEVLRTVYKEDDGNAWQQVMPAGNWQLEQVNVISRDIESTITAFINKPFDLSKDYMFRATLVETSPATHWLVVVMHHIASDGWSISVAVKELLQFYQSAVTGKPAALPALPVQYADYAIWQRNNLQGTVLDDKLQYWQQQLSGVNTLDLNTDYPRPPQLSGKGSSRRMVIDNDLTNQLQQLSLQQQSTLFMTLQAAFKILLYRYSRQEDICIGTPVAGREQQETESLVGFFINTLALRSNVNGQQSFVDFLQQVKATTLEAYEHQSVPFEQVVETVVKERLRSRSPIFQVLFVLQNTPEVPAIELGNTKISAVDQEISTTKFELTLTIQPSASQLVMDMEYSTDLYTADSIDRMLSHFNSLLRSIVIQPKTIIDQLGLLTTAERTQVLETLNDTAFDYDRSATLISLFEARAEADPSATALLFEQEAISYKLLDEQATRLAVYLQQQGVGKETLVPICIERSPMMIVSILAVMKAGGAYVPIDPSYPQERIAFMLEDTDASLAIVSNATKQVLANAVGNHQPLSILVTEDVLPQLQNITVTKLPAIVPTQLAYVIYTSGSTGKPKGVQVEHRSVVNLLSHQSGVYGISSKEIVLQFSNYCFDPSAEQIFIAFMHGAALVVFKEELMLDSNGFMQMIEQHEVTHLHTAPAFLESLRDMPVGKLKRIIVGGEACSKELADQWKDKVQFINEYGPTEATITSLEYVVPSSANAKGSITEQSQSLPVGKPLGNVKAYILNESKELCPVGVSGEIWLGGDCLARGYLKRDDLTKERFVKDPFTTNDQPSLMYRTGDVGRWLADGNVEYQGRIDEQVKIRGYRIELGEIESTLQSLKEIRQAVVTVVTDIRVGKRLAGYIVPAEGYTKESMIAALKTKLPDYMIPMLWTELEALPVTPNGKIDKKALPAPGIETATAYRAPQNELESTLVNIWQEILNVERVGIDDNFFELGGHSLLVLKLVSAIRIRLFIESTVNDIFIYPTIDLFSTNLIEKLQNPSSAEANIKYLVTLRGEGSKTPLYILAGGGGTALRFSNFSEMMDAEQPVYVLQPPVDGKQLKEFPSTVEKIAERFIEEIETKNPAGPYALAGHCLGGIIAFEMARQLKEKGRDVQLLALFDTVLTKGHTAPGIRNLYHVPRNIGYLLYRVIFKINFEAFLLRKHTKQALKYKVTSFKKMIENRKKRKQKVQLTALGVEVFEDSADLYGTATKKYVLSRYDGDIVLFYAQDHYFFTDVDQKIRFRKIVVPQESKKLWEQYANKTKIYDIEGEHSDMFDENIGAEFATFLQAELDKIAAEKSI